MKDKTVDEQRATKSLDVVMKYMTKSLAPEVRPMNMPEKELKAAVREIKSAAKKGIFYYGYLNNFLR
jgi:hypothetical protein